MKVKSNYSIIYPKLFIQYRNCIKKCRVESVCVKLNDKVLKNWEAMIFTTQIGIYICTYILVPGIYIVDLAEGCKWFVIMIRVQEMQCNNGMG